MRIVSSSLNHTSQTFLSPIKYFILKLICFHSSFSDDSMQEKTEIQSIHPTALIRHSCVCLLQALAIGCGLHANRLQIESVRTVSGLLHNLLDAGTVGECPRKATSLILALTLCKNLSNARMT